MFRSIITFFVLVISTLAFDGEPPPVTSASYDGVYFNRININRSCNGQCRRPFYMGEIQATFSARPVDATTFIADFTNLAYTDQDFVDTKLPPGNSITIQKKGDQLRTLEKLESQTAEAMHRLFNIKPQNSVFFQSSFLSAKKPLAGPGVFSISDKAFDSENGGHQRGRGAFLGQVTKQNFKYDQVRYSFEFSQQIPQKKDQAAMNCQGRFSYHDYKPAEASAPIYRSFWFLDVTCESSLNNQVLKTETTRINSFVNRLRSRR